VDGQDIAGKGDPGVIRGFQEKMRMNAIGQLIAFLKDMYRSRATILELTKRDFIAKYLGSYLGLIWAFIQPTITILIFWFVFEMGFRSQPVADFPFILWLMAGIIPWYFFSDSLSGATSSVLDHSFLVKKMVFRVSILPIVKILSALIIHLFFITALFLMFYLHGYKPSVYHLQVFYYLFAIIFLNLGLSWITSSLIIFLKDVGQIIGMLLQFGLWITPIFWTLKMIPERFHGIIKLNPAYYFVEGYRDSFIYHTWFWERTTLTLYFWGLASFIFILGAVLFRKLRPHFADVI
jgi:lipopolysaccharide transport system permease protein/teichoic acid transport system permease protein